MNGTILHVIATLDRGGTEVTALALAKEFSRRGIDNRVAVLERGRGAIAAEFEAIAGAPTLLREGRLARARTMRSLVKRLRPDAVLFHIFNTEHVVLGAAARVAGVRRIVAVLGNPVAAGPLMSSKVRRVVAVSDLLGIVIVSASRWIERTLAEAGSEPRRGRVIHNGCDIEAIGATADVAKTSRADAVVGMVARLDPIKDHAALIAAFARLPENVAGRRTRLVLIGDGVLRASLEAEVARLGIADRTIFAGSRNDVPEAIAGFDVFAFSTTRDEGFGVVLIEALAAGVPIVASDVPACREVLEDGALGRLVAPGDPDALAVALQEVLAHSPRPPSRAEVARRYGVEAMANAYLSLLLPEFRAGAVNGRA